MKMKKLIKQNFLGFTLVELSVAIAIFMILAGLVMVNLQYGNRANRLKEAANELAQNIRMVQSNAISGKTVLVCNGGDNTDKPCSSDGDCTPIDPSNTCSKYLVPKGGYGIKFLDELQNQTKFYTFFIDVDGCKRYDDNGKEQMVNGVIDLSQDKDIAIDELKIDGGTTDITTAELVFQPPLPTVFLNANCQNCSPSPCEPCDRAICTHGGSLVSQGDELEIVLRHEIINKTKSVKVNRISGKVSVE